MLLLNRKDEHAQEGMYYRDLRVVVRLPSHDYLVTNGFPISAIVLSA